MFLKCLFIGIFLTLGSSNNIKHKPTVTFSEEDTEHIVKAVLHCAPIHKIDPTTVFSEIREGTYEVTRVFQEFLHCTVKNAGNLRDDDSGHIDKVKVHALFPKDANVGDIIDTCNNEEGKDAVETTFKFFKCFQDKSPVGVKFV